MRKINYNKDGNLNREPNNINIPDNFYKQYSKLVTYVVYNRWTGLYKIGKTNNLSVRIKRLSYESGTILDVVKIFEKDIEKTLHREFKENRIIGEWFFLARESLKRIMEWV